MQVYSICACNNDVYEAACVHTDTLAFPSLPPSPPPHLQRLETQLLTNFINIRHLLHLPDPTGRHYIEANANNTGLYGISVLTGGWLPVCPQRRHLQTHYSTVQSPSHVHQHHYKQPFLIHVNMREVGWVGRKRRTWNEIHDECRHNSENGRLTVAS